MPRVLVAVEKLVHWDAVLPVLRWLEAADVEIRALFSGLHAPKPEIELIAESFGLEMPRIRWTRRMGSADSALMIGTTDDLGMMLSQGPRPFIAVPRLPLPAVLLRPPLPPSLTRTTSESRVTSSGVLLNPDHTDHIANLAVRTHGLPYLMTGYPELDQETKDDLHESIVILHSWDLGSGDEEQLAKQARALASVLTPLIPTGFRIELRPSEPRLLSDDIETIAHIVRSLQDTHSIPKGRIAIDPNPGWSSLKDARAILTLSSDDLLKALGAGAERAWWLSSLLPSTQASPRPRPTLPSCVLANRDAYDQWVRKSGWEEAPKDGDRIALLLGTHRDGHAGERVAQAILSALT